MFFWAPMWKWTMVIAGIADFARPASQLSRNNAASLVVNGVIGLF